MANAAIGLMPNFTRPDGMFPGVLAVAAKHGHIVFQTADTDASSFSPTTAAGQQPFGVCVSDGDPNNSDINPIGAVVDIATTGFADVLMDATTVISKGDKIIASSSVAGQGKVLAAEGAPYWLLGTSMQTITIGAAAGKISVKMAVEWVKT